MKHIKKVLLVFGLLLLILPIKAENTINVHLFYSETCPHCSNEIAWLDKTYKKDTNVNLMYYEVSELENQVYFLEVQELLNTPARGVPYLVIEDKVFVGYLEGYTDIEIKNKIDTLKKEGYHDPLSSLDSYQKPIIQEDKNFKVPLLGEITAKTVSLPLLAGVMGLVDGFNPCAMWVLVFLISMMLQTQDRKRMWLLGLLFILTSGFVYYLFMFGWLNVAVILSKMKMIQILIACSALGFGLYHIVKYIKTFNEQGCDVIDDKRRHKIIDKVKAITDSKSLLIASLSIVTLAILINIFELMCSLGLPVIFTQILSLNNLSFWQNQIYLLIYIFFFIIDDLIIFFIAMKTLKIKAISNRYAKISSLIGGIIMLVIGILMLLKPEWLMLNV